MKNPELAVSLHNTIDMLNEDECRQALFNQMGESCGPQHPVDIALDVLNTLDGIMSKPTLSQESFQSAMQEFTHDFGMLLDNVRNCPAYTGQLSLVITVNGDTKCAHRYTDISNMSPIHVWNRVALYLRKEAFAADTKYSWTTGSLVGTIQVNGKPTTAGFKYTGFKLSVFGMPVDTSPETALNNLVSETRAAVKLITKANDSSNANMLTFDSLNFLADSGKWDEVTVTDNNGVNHDVEDTDYELDEIVRINLISNFNDHCHAVHFPIRHVKQDDKVSQFVAVSDSEYTLILNGDTEVYKNASMRYLTRKKSENRFGKVRELLASALPPKVVDVLCEYVSESTRAMDDLSDAYEL